MDYKRAEHLQLLIDLTAEVVNELALTPEQDPLNALDLFLLSVSEATEQYQNITKKKQKQLIVGRVDTTKTAFSLQDRETVVVVQGDLEFAEMLELDYIGGEDDDEN